MKRVTGKELAAVKPFFELAATQARQATCLRASCGSVIVKDGRVLGQGYNGPAGGRESNRTCQAQLELSRKPKYDKTCCIHAEWRAILDACKRSGPDVAGSRLYFMRIDVKGEFTDAGEPYCTVCSRLSLESGVAEFALWNNDGADIYPSAEYDQKSYAFYL